MSKRKDITYSFAQSYVKDKDRVINTFVCNSLNKLQSMFTYEGLPDSIPEEELERILLTHGNCFVTKHNNVLYAFDGSCGGEYDEYNRPTIYTVSNAYLKLSENYEIGKDGILIKNDYCMEGILPILYKYAVLICDTEISLNTVAVLSRLSTIISASDDRTKASAELFMKKITDGDLSIIAESPFIEGIKTYTATNTSVTITELIELYQYYKASFHNEIGLNANYNMKRESLNDSELALNIDSILPLTDSMLHERQKGVEAVNKMFGTDIHVDFNSVWKATHEQSEKVIAESITDYEQAIETMKQGEEIEENELSEFNNEETENDIGTDSNEVIAGEIEESEGEQPDQPDEQVEADIEETGNDNEEVEEGEEDETEKDDKSN